MRYFILAMALAASPAMAVELNTSDIQERWAKAAETCKGGGMSAEDIGHACGERDAYASILVTHGYCFSGTRLVEGQAFGEDDIACQ